METMNPSSEKMTTGRVTGLKAMPMGKTLVGSFSQPFKEKRIEGNTCLIRCLYILLMLIAKKKETNKDNPEFHYKTDHFH